MNAREYVEKWFVKEDNLRAAISEGLLERNVTNISISADVAKTLDLLVKISGAQHILEIGTHGGYSTISLARALTHTGKVTTLEMNEEMADFAMRNIRQAGLDHIVTIHVGHALDSLANLKQENQKFDLIFIDADKENYSNYYHLSMELANPHALIVADNALWGDKVLDEFNHEESTEGVRGFNELISTDQRVDAMLLTIGDGLVVARVK